MVNETVGEAAGEEVEVVGKDAAKAADDVGSGLHRSKDAREEDAKASITCGRSQQRLLPRRASVNAFVGA